MTKPQKLTESGLARELGVSRQAVHDLVKRNIIPKDKDGLIDVELAKVALLNRVRPSGKTNTAIQETSQPTATTSPPEIDEDAEITSYHVAKTLREAAEAQIARLKLAEMKGELIKVDAVRAAWAAKITGARDALLQIPSRVAPVLAACTDLVEVTALLEAELRQALADLSAEAPT